MEFQGPETPEDEELLWEDIQQVLHDLDGLTAVQVFDNPPPAPQELAEDQLIPERPDVTDNLTNEQPRDEEKKTIIPWPITSSTDKFRCPICQALISHKRSLSRHILRHTQDEIDLIEREKPVRKGRYQCPVCNKALAKRDSFKSHMKLHKKEDPFKAQVREKTGGKKLERSYLECNICGKRVTRKDTMVRHIELHMKEKPKRPAREFLRNSDGHFYCSFCMKQYHKRESLINHLREKHHGRDETCQFCDRQFNNSEELKRHVSIHTGDTPFACTVCDEDFPLRSMLDSHKNIHTVEKPLPCKVCAKREHTYAPEKQNCPHCSKVCSDKMELISHLRTHKGEKPYACHFCKQTLRAPGYSEVHERFNTGHKPYKCTACLKQFAATWNWKFHMVAHSEERPLL